MSPFKLSVAGLALVAGLGLSACATDGYGYGGVSAGYADWDPYSGGYRGDPYWGWYGDSYYPGTGYYVYDRNNRRHRWDNRQRDYWRGRVQTWHNARREVRPVWRDYGIDRGRGDGRRDGWGDHRRRR